jgi:putative transposase
MPRRARLNLPGIPWHVVQRGNNRGACFFESKDYRYYLAVLREQAARFGCAIHAYVLMTNHVHLLLTPTAAESAGGLMKSLGQHYTQFVNRKYGRTGCLWEGRFKSCLTRDERYVLNCYRYIEFNPVRAGIVGHPRDYAWSSYMCNGEGAVDALITRHEHYSALGLTDESRQAAYRQLLSRALDDASLAEIRAATKGNVVLGGQRFQEEMAQLLRRRVSPGKGGRPRSVKTGDRPRFS